MRPVSSWSRFTEPRFCLSSLSGPTWRFTCRSRIAGHPPPPLDHILSSCARPPPQRGVLEYILSLDDMLSEPDCRLSCSQQHDGCHEVSSVWSHLSHSRERVYLVSPQWGPRVGGYPSMGLSLWAFRVKEFGSRGPSGSPWRGRPVSNDCIYANAGVKSPGKCHKTRRLGSCSVPQDHQLHDKKRSSP